MQTTTTRLLYLAAAGAVLILLPRWLEHKHPSFARLHLHGHDVFVQDPVGRVPRAVLFVAHGCSHGGGDFFLPSPACPECLGLPEERAIAGYAAHHGVALIAISSGDREGSRCWHVGHDLQPVAAAIDDVVHQRDWQHLPRYALGASSGGAFVMHLPQVMHLAGLCSQIMALPTPMLQRLCTSTAYPPTMFVHMPRDNATAVAVEANMATLHAAGVQTTARVVLPSALTPTYFSDRIAGLPETTSQAYVAALRAAALVDADGRLELDPRASTHRWRPVLEKAGASSLEADTSPIFEALNVAWASHEIIGDVMDDVFAFWGLLVDGQSPKVKGAL